MIGDSRQARHGPSGGEVPQSDRTAPPRRPDAPEELRTFVYAEPKPGTLYLWESWLRHEVVPHAGRGAKASERISISFNYR